MASCTQGVEKIQWNQSLCILLCSFLERAKQMIALKSVAKSHVPSMPEVFSSQENFSVVRICLDTSETRLFIE